ncbi:collagen alpha-1(I) chain [Penaeus vannamei]|uniref:collagen alpha-1(I) chain n=1 Tax=Penaeus vannamei TaxID=6689 RepID=UPI00387F8378
MPTNGLLPDGQAASGTRGKADQRTPPRWPGSLRDPRECRPTDSSPTARQPQGPEGKPTNGLLPDGQAASGTRGNADQRTPPRWPGSLRDPRESRPTDSSPTARQPQGPEGKPTNGLLPDGQAASGTRGNADQRTPPRWPGSLRDPRECRPTDSSPTARQPQGPEGKPTNLPDGQAASGTRGKADQRSPPRWPGSLRDPRECRPTDSSPMARQPQGPEGKPTNRLLPDGQAASGTRGNADQPPRWPGSLRDPRESRPTDSSPMARQPQGPEGKPTNLPDGQAASGTRGKADQRTPPRRPGSLRDPRESRPTDSSPTARQPQGPEGMPTNLPDGQAASGTRGKADQPTPPRWPGSLRDPRESRPTSPMARQPQGPEGKPTNRLLPDSQAASGTRGKADQPPRWPGSLRDPRESRPTDSSPTARQPQGPEGKPTNRLLPDGQAASGTRGKADQRTPPRRPGSLRDPRESRPTDSSPTARQPQGPEGKPTNGLLPDGQAASGTRGKADQRTPPRRPGSLRDPRESRPTDSSPTARQPQGPEGMPTNLPDGQAASGTRGKADQPTPPRWPGSLRDPRESRPTSPMARQPQGPEGMPTNLPDGQAASGTRGKADQPTPPRWPGSLRDPRECRPTSPMARQPQGPEGKPTNRLLPDGQAASGTRGKADQPPRWPGSLRDPRESRPTDSSPTARQPQGPEGKPTNGLLPDGQAVSGTRGKADQPPRRPGSLRDPRESRPTDSSPMARQSQGPEGKPTNGLLPDGQAASGTRGKADQPPRRPGSLRDPRESRPTDSSPMARQSQGPEGMPTNLPDGQAASGTRGKADQPPRRPGSLRDPRESRPTDSSPTARQPQGPEGKPTNRLLPDGQAVSGTRGNADQPPRRPGSLRDPRESRPTSPTARQPQGPEGKPTNGLLPDGQAASGTRGPLFAIQSKSRWQSWPV